LQEKLANKKAAEKIGKQKSRRKNWQTKKLKEKIEIFGGKNCSKIVDLSVII